MASGTLKNQIENRIAKADGVWTPSDFLDLAGRHAVDKTLQRMALAGTLRRIDRGLYDKPSLNSLTRKPRTPDYRQVVDAIGRRDQARMLIDGMTAANDLGLTDAVPGKVILHSDVRRKPIRLDNLVIEFKPTAPSKLYWAGRPAMRLVQALHWLRDMFPAERDSIRRKVSRILDDPSHGPPIREDLREGFATLPGWMQRELRDLLADPAAADAGGTSDDRYITAGVSAADHRPTRRARSARRKTSSNRARRSAPR